MAESPDIPDLPPLPEVPSLPLSPSSTAKPRPTLANRSGSSSSPQPRKNASATTSSGHGNGSGNGTSQGSGESPAGSDRWIGLRKVKPAYPTSCRRNRETGKVLIRFTVDERGNVVNAQIVQPCPYSALNDAALASVRRFKARPGPRATGLQSVVFQLN